MFFLAGPILTQLGEMLLYRSFAPDVRLDVDTHMNARGETRPGYGLLTGCMYTLGLSAHYDYDVKGGTTIIGPLMLVLSNSEWASKMSYVPGIRVSASQR
jgi:hypothetical protein